MIDLRAEEVTEGLHRYTGRVQLKKSGWVVNTFVLDTYLEARGYDDVRVVKPEMMEVLNKCIRIYKGLASQSYFDLSKQERELRADMKKVLFSYSVNISSYLVDFVKRANVIDFEKKRMDEMLAKGYTTVSKKQERKEKIRDGIIKVITAPLKLASFLGGVIALSILIYVPKAIMGVPKLMGDLKARIKRKRDKVERVEAKILED